MAALLSFVIPGAGQMYQERVGFGLVLFIGAVAGYVMCVIPGICFHLFAIVDAAVYKQQ